MPGDEDGAPSEAPVAVAVALGVGAVLAVGVGVALALGVDAGAAARYSNASVPSIGWPSGDTYRQSTV